MIDKAIMQSELRRDEGARLTVYDDASGSPIKPGVAVKGHPTIGVGRALDVHGITESEAAFLLNNDIDRTVVELESGLPCFAALDPVRQRVLVNMAFNMGTAGLLGFHDTLRCISEGRYEAAALHMEDSIWYRQVGARAARLVVMMRAGAA